MKPSNIDSSFLLKESDIISEQQWGWLRQLWQYGTQTPSQLFRGQTSFDSMREFIKLVNAGLVHDTRNGLYRLTKAGNILTKQHL